MRERHESHQGEHSTQWEHQTTLKLRQILNLPVPRDNMPWSSTTVWVLNDVAGQQELGPKGPSAMLPLSPRRCFLINSNRTFRLLIYLKINL